MKYKVGDKVRVRDDLEKEKEYGLHIFDAEMEEYKGKQAIIKRVLYTCYVLNIDNSIYGWTDEMLEPIAKNGQNTEKSTVKSGQFTKEDLKFGHIVTLRNGNEHIYIPIEEKLYNLDNMGYLRIEGFNNNLSHKTYKNFDIMKVQRLCQYEEGQFKVIDVFRYKTLYERKEEILTEKEKEWLKNVISAFEVKVLFIRKDSDDFQIKLGIAETFYPTIKLNLIKYKFEGMEDGKEYTLEELGL